MLGQLQFNILTYIDVKVAIAPVDADLIVEILQDAPSSQIASIISTGQISAYGLNDVVVFGFMTSMGMSSFPRRKSMQSGILTFHPQQS